MRLRTGRFEILRSGQAWHPWPINVRNGQHRFEQSVTVTSPPMAVVRHLQCYTFRSPKHLQFPTDRPGSPLLPERDRP